MGVERTALIFLCCWNSRFISVGGFTKFMGLKCAWCFTLLAYQPAIVSCRQENYFFYLFGVLEAGWYGAIDLQKVSFSGGT